MFLPTPHIFLISDVLFLLSGGDLIDSKLQSILHTIGFILVCLFGYKTLRSALKEG